VAVASYRHERIPDSHADLIVELAGCADAIADELAADRQASAVRDRLIEVGRRSSGLERSAQLSAEVVLAQARSLVADLLAVCGMDPLGATDEIPPLDGERS
jgi:hypothetical protein